MWADTRDVPRKTIRTSRLELERWQRAAEYVGVSLSELIATATARRVEQIEDDRVADLELDRYVREQIDAATVARSSVTCGCVQCTRQGLPAAHQDK